MPEPRQAAFAFPFQPHFTEQDFVDTPANALARRWLAADTWPTGRLALCGEAGIGKTHLLHIWAARTGATLLPGPALHAGWPGGPLALDQADETPDEEALLHVLNAAAEAGHPVLLAARPPPARWPVRLPDLASRLRATPAVELLPGDDAFLATLLARLVAARQIEVPPRVQTWLLARLPRHPDAVRDAVARLDQMALAAGSAIGLATARTVLADLPQAEIGPEAIP